MTKAIKKSWKIGELASETGLTVRSLHYYDELGLLKPSSETEGGHRVYTRGDLERLQKIMTLKQLGFSLDKIKEALEQPQFSMKNATSKLRADLKKRKSELEDMEKRLAEAEEFQAGKDVPTDSIVQLLARMSLLDRHLSEEQLTWIKRHDTEFGAEYLNELRAEWIAATEELQKAISNKLSPSDWRTKAICMRWFGLATAFMGGSLEWVYELKSIADAEPSAALQLGIPGTDLKKVFEYVELVLAEAANHPIEKALAYAQVGVSNLKEARAFYDRVLGRLEMKPIFPRATDVVYGKTNPELIVGIETHDEKPLKVGNTGMVGFWTRSKEEVDAVYQEAISAGGTSIHAPFFQSNHLYTCTIADLDGNRLEIMKWFDSPDKPTG